MDAQTFINAAGGQTAPKPQRTILFMGNYVAGTLASMTIDQDMDLVGMNVGNFSGFAMITAGRTVTSFAAGFNPSGCMAMAAQNMFWSGRIRYNTGDKLYLDTNTGMTAPGCCVLMFEPR